MQTAIKERINADAIAGHQAAIDKIVESIGDRMEDHGSNPIVDAQINQDVTALRILSQELIQMKGRSLTIQLSKTEYGYLVDALGGNLDIGKYCCTKAEAWEYFMYLLRNGRHHDS
jgi:hypothetical protein